MLVYNSKFPSYVANRFSDYILIRFFPSEDKMRFFLSGKLFMNPPNIYHNKELGEGVYDGMEAATLSVLDTGKQGMPKVEFGEKDGHSYFTVRYLKPKEITEDYKEPHFIYWPNGPKKQNVLCLYSLWFNDTAKSFLDINKEMIENFGQYGVVIGNRLEFFNRIGKAISSLTEIQSAECGFVEYLSDEKTRGIVDWTPFMKRATGYSYQNEFRVCIQKDYEGSYVLDLGISLDDIAFPINTKHFLETLQFSDDGIISFEDML